MKINSLYKAPPKFEFRTQDGLSTHLEQAVNFTRLGVNVDVQVARGGRQTRDSLDVCGERVAMTSH